MDRYLRQRRPLPALALNANSPAVTAIGHDYEYDEVSARQLEALAASGDLAVAISTSGNSINANDAVACAPHGFVHYRAHGGLRRPDA